MAKIKARTGQRPFTIVYNDFLDSKLLDKYEKMVFITLKRYTNGDTMLAFPSLKRISEISGVTKSKVAVILHNLEEMGIIKRMQSMKNGSYINTVYTLVDDAEIWKCEREDAEHIQEIVNARELERAKRVLQDNGYDVIEKEKVAVPPTTSSDLSPNQNKLNSIMDNSNNDINCQQEIMPLSELKAYFNYDIMTCTRPNDIDLIDSFMSVLYDLMNTTKATIKVANEDKPRGVVLSKLYKLTYEEILYCITNYKAQSNRVRNSRAYITTMLYGAREQMQLDYTNKVNNSFSGNN